MIAFNLGEDGIAVITIDDPQSALNILTKDALSRLRELADDINGAAGSSPKGLIIISGKPDNFIVGADINEFNNFVSIADATTASKNMQQVFRKFSAFPFPTVAAINGTCMGGGLELALNCTARIVTDHSKSAMSFPEVTLGILPGATGSQLLPRLIGLQQALDIMLTGKNVYPGQALKMGLVDEVVNSTNLLQASRDLILSGQLKKPVILGRIRSPLAKISKSVIVRVVKHKIKQSAGDHYPAPFAILDLVKKTYGKDLQAGLSREAETFAQLNDSAQSEALKHLFFAGSDRHSPSAADARSISEISIIGAGLMGAGIGTLALDRGIAVRQKDVSHQALGRGSGHVHQYFDRRVKKRILARRDKTAKLANYSMSTSYTGMTHSQISIEAVFEDLDLKRQIVADLEEAMSEDAIIATNTSALSISEIGQGALHPERIVGMHFFSPVEKIPLLEIIPSSSTDDQTLATAVALGKRLGKKVIVVKDSPGFFVNRILTPYLGEVFKLLKEGVAVEKLDALVKSLGFPVGPCTLMDEVGMDVIAKVVGVMMPTVGERLEMEDVATIFVRNKRLGRKNGLGFYKYNRGSKAGIDKSVYELLGKPARKRIDAQEVSARLLYSILNEAAYALEEGIINSPSIGDIGAVYGFGYPAFTGGPYWQIDQIGAEQFVDYLMKMKDKHGSRFEPAPALVAMAAAGKKYYG